MDKIKIAVLLQNEYMNTQNEPSILSKISSVFGDNECERLKAIGNKKARAASLGGLAALLKLVGKGGGVICRDVNGKPYFADASLGCFNISHSGMVSVAAYGEYKLGVDVERIDRERDTARIVGRFFTEKEQQRFYKSGADAERFFEIWTEKESYVKCLGGTFASLCSVDPIGVVFSRCYLTSDDGDYIVTVCSDSEFELETEALSDGIIIKDNKGERNVSNI